MPFLKIKKVAFYKQRKWALIALAVSLVVVFFNNQFSEEEPPKLALGESLFLGKSTLKNSSNPICNLNIPSIDELPDSLRPSKPGSHNGGILSAADNQTAITFNSDPNLNRNIQHEINGVGFVYTNNYSTTIGDVFRNISSSSDNKVFVATYFNPAVLEGFDKRDSDLEAGFYVYPPMGTDHDIKAPDDPRFSLPARHPFIVGSCKPALIKHFENDTTASSAPANASDSLKSGWSLLTVPEDFFRDTEKGEYMRKFYHFAEKVWVQTGPGYQFANATEHLKSGELYKVQAMMGDHRTMWIKFGPQRRSLIGKISAGLHLKSEEERRREAIKEVQCMQFNSAILGAPRLQGEALALFNDYGIVYPEDYEFSGEDTHKFQEEVGLRELSRITGLCAPHAKKYINPACPVHLKKCDQERYTFFNIQTSKPLERKALKIGKGDPVIVDAITLNINESVEFFVDETKDLLSFYWHHYQDGPKDKEPAVSCFTLGFDKRRYRCEGLKPEVIPVYLNNHTEKKKSEQIYLHIID